MKPEYGARFTLRLTQSTPQVVYGVEVELPDATIAGVVTVEPSSGAVRVTAEPQVPGWLESTVVGLLRSLWRVRRNPSESDPWPRRLTRWRNGDGVTTG